ncbi:MAG TPA: AMP-binding protein, partial [Candidatus Kapabacteria bacterium]|nr:AMP-binding protein [Candidatus Kapabacteria bacterium]
MRSINKSIDLADILNRHIKEQNYWLNQLSGDWEKCSFPAYDTKKVSRQKEMQSLSFQVDSELFEKIMKLRNGSDIRLFIILAAGLATLLFKYTDNCDIVLGSPVLKQDQGMDVEFINTVLTLRNRITGTMSFKELLLQVKQTVAEATQHQNYPVEHLPELLNIPFLEGEDFPLFDAAVLLENIHDKAYTRAIPLNMIFSFNRNPQDITGIIEYNLNIYDRWTIERIRDHFIRMFQVILSNIDNQISNIDILSEEEKNCLLMDFNNSQMDCPGNVFMHRLFEEQVEKTPEHPVLIFANEQTTYRELNEKANRIGEALVIRGVRAGSLLGIMTKPSSMMIAAILGILKAGGAYLPIDPIYPPERIAFIIQDSRLPFLLTHEAQVSNKLLREGIDVVDLDEISGNGGVESNFTVLLKDSDPAYIIYTSGTTGKPKGVVVEHRQAVNTLICRKTEYGLDDHTVSLQLFSYSFDGFVTSFFTPITAGALVVLLSNEELLDIDKIKDAIRRYRVTHFISVPTLFQAILEVVNEEDIKSLRVVTLAGEQLLPKIVDMAKRKNKNLEIAHEYGVTEAAVMSTLY